MRIQENGSRIPAAVARVKARTAEDNPAKKSVSGHTLFMMACCAAMVAGTAIIFASAPAGQSLGETLLLAAPVLGCLGMHVVMHRFMGRSCHGAENKDQKND
ncbi:hypothetical protein [Roseibium album]|uniref:hypothetical protein n=1 Tax=Roseibium album TaxID=311410 RepID=UPI000CF0CD7D|nr:hypothetical protein [Labrenzia sp. EL_142]